MTCPHTDRCPHRRAASVASPAAAFTSIGISPTARTGVRRDALLRRLLAVADLSAAAFAALLIGSPDQWERGELAVLAYLPTWIVVAKLCGLYDRDQRELRHLTVDDVPTLLVWSLVSVAGLAVFLQITFGSSLTLAEGARCALAAATPLVRCFARWPDSRGGMPRRLSRSGSSATGARAQRSAGSSSSSPTSTPTSCMNDRA